MDNEKLMAIVNEALLDATAPFSRPKDPLSMKEFCLSFAERVAAVEREACALAAEAVVPRHTECGNKIAAAIRARGQHD
jgi:hypothetical protein